MVPNHMGIDSPWVVEHPDWFLSRPDMPYPAYSFEGPDLSHRSRVEIKIEDHYYEQTRRCGRVSAARQVDRRDPVHLPRQRRYQLSVERYRPTGLPEAASARAGDPDHPAGGALFPVIRFDAAMTLAKRHIQRLWFPGPGSSGAIPSRAEYSMTDG